MTKTAPLAPGLHIAATPIGNLGDVTPRLLDALRMADLILCEDTRVTGHLLSHFGIETSMRPYHDHNAAQTRPDVLAKLRDGAAIVLVSDAGTPLIADPGYKLVAEARAQETPIFAIPGPSAVITALSIAGVPTDRFSFLGFLPPKQTARRKVLAEVADRYGETLVFYETAPRLANALSDIAAEFGDPDVVIGRELTKRHEEIVSGTASALANQYAEAPTKGEIVLIIAPRIAPAASDEDVDTLMQRALKTMRLKEASAHVASLTGRRKRDLYQAYLGRQAP